MAMGPFMSQKTVSVIFFSERRAWDSFFTGKSMCFNYIDYPF